ncbi:spore protease YyaC [Alteribacillus bidgolensis]|uniref:Putative sporulation protein YyaC n=1 Tax=Alteribacillus bidgolensis TaxID=930129 RepID=A0A1G8LR72_9BACI|nr:spore protease YyaC [Alteribacillus bidgolensis]SDI58115.1 putative sporulation protein YyaC [Alteribacillus bidgolensis]
MLGKKPASTRIPFSYQVHSEETGAASSLASQLAEQLDKVPSYRDIVVVCIGTDRSTGDSLGPIIGSSLEKSSLKRLCVYGTLAKPVHAVNLEETIEMIQRYHHRPFIVAIDACLGRVKNVGKINFSEGPVIPGAAMKKKLPHVGEMHVTGIVNVSGMMEYFVLQNTRLYTVMAIADCISQGFILADNKLKFPSSSITKNNVSQTPVHTKGLSKTESAFSLQQIHHKESPPIDES